MLGCCYVHVDKQPIAPTQWHNCMQVVYAGVTIAGYLAYYALDSWQLAEGTDVHA